MELIKSDENYTPQQLINTVNVFFDGIDFDPFSSYIANQVIKAKRHYGLQPDNTYIDALTAQWINGHTWINPPYSRGIIGKAVDLAVTHACNSNILILVNSSTTSKWYQKLLSCCDAMLFFDRRLQFTNPFEPNRKSGNRYDQTLFYLSFGGKNHGCRDLDLAFFGHTFYPWGKIIIK